MMQAGTNLPPQLVSVDGARGYVPAGSWLRFVAEDDMRQMDLADGLSEAGFKLLLVLTKASLHEASATYWAEVYGGLADAVQVINEPDAAPGSPSSDVMSQDALFQYLVDVSLAFPPSMPLVGPGLCSGQPAWWDADLNARVDAIAVHPYGKSPRDAAALLQAYWDRWQKEILVTEYVDPDHPSGGDLLGLYDAFRALPFVTVALNYGLSPAWANGFGGHMPSFVLGFKDYAAQHPEVGQPLEDEQSLAAGYQSQMTTTGLLLYSKQANAITFLGKE